MTLSSILNEKFRGNYDNLFTPQGGYLIREGKRWKLTKTRIREPDKLEYFTNIAKALVEEGVLGTTQEPVELIKRINQEWTICLLKERGVQLAKQENDTDAEILFSSKIVKYSYLSNFFPTLILSEEPIKNSGKVCVYFSSENQYLAWKASLTNPQLANKIAKGLDPKKAKKEAKRDEERSSMREAISSDQKIQKMTEIVTKKFEQNPVLRKQLIGTQRRVLKENTKDLFWGIGNQSEVGENHLGRILMIVRDGTN